MFEFYNISWKHENEEEIKVFFDYYLSRNNKPIFNLIFLIKKK